MGATGAGANGGLLACDKLPGLSDLGTANSLCLAMSPPPTRPDPGVPPHILWYLGTNGCHGGLGAAGGSIRPWDPQLC